MEWQVFGLKISGQRSILGDLKKPTHLEDDVLEGLWEEIHTILYNFITEDE